MGEDCSKSLNFKFKNNPLPKKVVCLWINRLCKGFPDTVQLGFVASSSRRSKLRLEWPSAPSKKSCFGDLCTGWNPTTPGQDSGFIVFFFLTQPDLQWSVFFSFPHPLPTYLLLFPSFLPPLPFPAHNFFFFLWDLFIFLSLVFIVFSFLLFVFYFV